MSYIKNNLMPSETIVHDAQVHWLIYGPTLAAFIGGVAVCFSQVPAAPFFGGVAILISVPMAVGAFVTRHSFELAVTSRRVIARKGIISRETVEINNSKIESVMVDQSILGRLFDFGTVTVSGSGGNKAVIPCVDGPIEFRNKALSAVDLAQA